MYREVKKGRKTICLAVDMGRKLDQRSKKRWALNLKSSILKPNASLAKFVEDLRKLGKGVSKQDHILIVGGPGNSLDNEHYHYTT
jgi:hypothetical protein